MHISPAPRSNGYLDNVEGARAKAERGELLFGNIDTFLIWRLTKGRVHVTDYSNASRTLLFNIYTREWDDVLLKELGVPRSMLPKVMPSSAVYGECDAEFFGSPIPLAGDAGDQQAATFGQACYGVGMAKNTYGTGSFLLMNTGHEGTKSRNGLLTSLGWGLFDPADPEITYVLGGEYLRHWSRSAVVARWLKAISTVWRSKQWPGTEPDNGGVYMVPAFVGLGAPYWDPNARGAIMGLTRGSTIGHVAQCDTGIDVLSDARCR